MNDPIFNRKIEDYHLDPRNNAVISYSHGDRLIFIMNEESEFMDINSLLLYSSDGLEALSHRKILGVTPVFWTHGRFSQRQMAEYWDEALLLSHEFDSKLDSREMDVNVFMNEGYRDIAEAVETNLYWLTWLRRNSLQIVQQIPDKLPFILPEKGSYHYKNAKFK